MRFELIGIIEMPYLLKTSRKIYIQPMGGKYITLDGESVSTGRDAEPAAQTDPKVGKRTEDRTLEPGDTMEDGTIFAGVSPDTGRNMFVPPKDAPGVLKWKAAMKYAADLDANGHRDWKLPTKAELDVLYQNRDKGALKGTFDVSGSWSAAENPDYPVLAWMERFSDGHRSWNWKDVDASVRPVRSEPRP